MADDMLREDSHGDESMEHGMISTSVSSFGPGKQLVGGSLERCTVQANTIRRIGYIYIADRDASISVYPLARIKFYQQCIGLRGERGCGMSAIMIWFDRHIEPVARRVGDLRVLIGSVSGEMSGKRREEISH